MSEGREKYSEEEALTEAERLSGIVNAHEGKKSYEDAERWLKATRREVRPKFSEEEFAEVKRVLQDLFKWDDESTSEEERDEEVRADLSELYEKRDVFINAYDHQRGFLFDLYQLAQDFGIRASNKADRENIQAFGIGVIRDLSPKIVKDIQAGRGDVWAIPNLSLLVENEDEDLQKIGLQALVDVRQTIGEDFLEKNRSYHAIHALTLLRKKGTPEQSLVAAEIAKSALEKTKDQRVRTQLVAFLAVHESPEMAAEGLRVVHEVLTQCHLPLELTDIWEKSAAKPDQKGTTVEQAIVRNITAITQLEHTRPGACELLYKEFGIADFGRYPTQLLETQCEEAGSSNKPYGVVLFPRNDWNGAFYGDNLALNELFEELHGEFGLRVVECEGKMDVARALIDLNRRYNPADGSGHKISLAIIGGHGTENSIRFGGDDDRHALFTEDLQGRGVQRTSEFFKDNPTFILVSCSTGADKGIGQKLSEIMGAKVIAPKVPTSISKYQVGKRKGGKFRFNAEYTKDEGDTKSVYVGGQEIE